MDWELTFLFYMSVMSTALRQKPCMSQMDEDVRTEASLWLAMGIPYSLLKVCKY